MATNPPDSLPDDELREQAEGERKSANDGGIPNEQDGVGMGASDEPNTFEPEEAGDAVDDDDEEEGPQ